MTEQRHAHTQDDRMLVIDGTAEDGTYQGDALHAPFVIFDVDAQKNIAGPFADMTAAKVALRRAIRAYDLAGPLTETRRQALGEVLTLTRQLTEE